VTIFEAQLNYLETGIPIVLDGDKKTFKVVRQYFWNDYPIMQTVLGRWV
jgi:hypothetical protein